MNSSAPFSDHDLQASSRFAAQVAARVPKVEIHPYPVGHFAGYLGSWCDDEISCTQAEFLHRQLCS